jgi:hypothetical protein
MSSQHPLRLNLILGALLILPLVATAADVSVQPASGSGFVVKDAGGATERFRVQENGQISLPGVIGAVTQSQALCMSAAGLLGPCSAGGGAAYSAGTGLNLAGSAFSVAPGYQLPQGCAANQLPQANGAGGWTCVSVAGAGLPAGTVNQTLRYDASNTPVANNLLQAGSDGELVAIGAGGPPSTAPSGAGSRMLWHVQKAAFRAGVVAGNEWDEANIGLYSTATGSETIASGQNSVAMGAQSKATGVVATALGSGTTASGDIVSALGYQTTASGYASTASGFKTVASGAYSLAMGFIATASGDTSVAIGSDVHATAPNAMALGYATTASGNNATALGNSTTASGKFATALGMGTTASGSASTAMGNYANTNNHTGSFVYADGPGTTLSTADRQFMVRASGGVVFYSAAAPDTSTGIQLAAGSGSWTALSDRNTKDAVQPVDAREVLAKVAALPLATWHYKTQDDKYRHMGPMAQDFYAAFHLGETDKGIDTIDADGVALAAIQGLHTENLELRMQLDKQAADNARLRERVTQLEAQSANIAALKAAVKSMLRERTGTLAVAEAMP